MIECFQRKAGNSRLPAVSATLLILTLTGTIDYLSGYHLHFSVFYMLAVGIATWFLGRRCGLLTAGMSVLVWIVGDIAAGVRYDTHLILAWNAMILLVFYCIIVWLLDHLRGLHDHLESRVRERTRELEKEMSERRRLQEEILKIAEGEQRRIAYDLHDGLCQHLTATALAGQVLSERLALKSATDASDARKVVDLVERGISLARNYARGLAPVEVDAEGLMAAFREMALQINRSTNIKCHFDCASPVLIHDNTVAMHLFRIGQEAVSNAVRHGDSTRIGISLTEDDGGLNLLVEDDGKGISANAGQSEGLGSRIMAYRASIIGGVLGIKPAATGGTIVTCTVNRESENPSKKLSL